MDREEVPPTGEPEHGLAGPSGSRWEPGSDETPGPDGTPDEDATTTTAMPGSPAAGPGLRGRGGRVAAAVGIGVLLAGGGFATGYAVGGGDGPHGGPAGHHRGPDRDRDRPGGTGGRDRTGPPAGRNQNQNAPGAITSGPFT